MSLPSPKELDLFRQKKAAGEKPLWKDIQTDNKPDAPVGLGDVVHTVTNFFGIPECNGCKERREVLNKIPIPFT